VARLLRKYASHYAAWAGMMLPVSMIALLSSEAEGSRIVEVTIKQSEFRDHELNVTKSAQKGDLLHVKLEWIANGYVWKLSKADARSLKRVGEGPPETIRERSVPGASEYRLYRFEVIKDGELEFRLARPFGRNPDTKVLRLKIEAR
jgi:predicted secreted protein